MKQYKRFFCTFLALVMLLSVLPVQVLAEGDGADVAINEENFPDGVFRGYITEKFDADQDGILTQEERDGVNLISISGDSQTQTRGEMTSLEGIEFFTDLEFLSCGFNKLTELDLSKNPKLQYVSCSDNMLTDLDVSQNTQLKELACSNNQLKTLDVSSSTQLTRLICDSNQLTALDVRKNGELTYLQCSANQLKTLDVTQNPKLTTLNCFVNELTALDVSKNALLETLWAWNNQLTGLDLQYNTQLTQLSCEYNQLTALDVSKNTLLTELQCDGNPLKTLDVSKNPALTTLWCNGNQLKALDLSQNPKLENLYCADNQLTELNLENLAELKRLGCYDNALTQLDVSRNLLLTSLNCFNNNLTSMDISQNTVLRDVWLEPNTYVIQVGSDDTFDLSTLPGAFDVTKATDWKGGTVEGNILKVEKNVISYTYSCGKGIYATFTLVKPGAVRIYGADRYQTSFKAADTLKEELGISMFDNIIVASGTGFADALAGSYLAAKNEAPILLVRASNVNTVKEYIRKNLRPGGTVYLLGGVNAVPKTMETGLDEFAVKRLGGATRYDTNLMILKEAGAGKNDLVIVCTGQNFADSLSASATGFPILLVKGSLTQDQKDFLKGTSGYCVIVGGTNAVSTTVEKQLQEFGSVNRIAGSTRYETSVMVAQRFFTAPRSAVVAYAQNFPDGLSGGPLAYAMGAPLILTANGREAVAVAYTTGCGIRTGYVLGGPGLISDKAVEKIFTLH